MLSFFPKPYEDETLYSLVSRYHTYSGNTTVRLTNEELFGSRSYKNIAQIPAGLDRLSRVTESFGLSFDHLLFECTLFPYYSLFSQEEARREQYKQMKAGKVQAWSSFLGISRGKLLLPCLRYCPLCRKKELEEWGESYWHRIHQIPELTLCPVHGIPLKNSLVLVREAGRQYISAGCDWAVPEESPSVYTLPDRRERQLEIQAGISYCVSQHRKIREVFLQYDGCFAPLYLELLREKGLATENGTLKKIALEEFKRYWGEDLLHELGLSWKEVSRPWLVSICRRNHLAFDPIKHILLGQFLAGSMRELIKEGENRRPALSLERPLIQYHQVADFHEKRVRYRERWMNACENVEMKSITAIKAQDQAAHTWLRRHDKQWLLEHLPPPEKRGGNIREKDWVSYDMALASKVSAAAEAVITREGKPVRITRAEILRQLGISSNYYSHNREKLPRTTEQLQSHMETTEAWQRRKIRWVIEERCRNQKDLSFWQIMKEAGIRDQSWEQYRGYVTDLVAKVQEDIILFMRQFNSRMNNI